MADKKSIYTTNENGEACVRLTKTTGNTNDITSIYTTNENGEACMRVTGIEGGGGSGAVDSVNGKTGNVVLTGADINAEISETTNTVQEHLQKIYDSAELKSNKVNEITDDNKESTEGYPSNKATVDYVNKAVGEIATFFRFSGFFSVSAPTDGREGNLWSMEINMPTEFPINVKIFTNGHWTDSPDPYTPIAGDLWTNTYDGYTYYYAGDSWHKVDADISPDNNTIEKNQEGKLQVKDGGISLQKIANQSPMNAGKVLSVNSDGNIDLALPSGGSEVKVYKLVDGYVLDEDDERVIYSVVKENAKNAVFVDESAMYARAFRFEGIKSMGGNEVIIIKCAADINPSETLAGSILAVLMPNEDNTATTYVFSNYGGIYLDTDIQVAQSFNDLDGKSFDVMTGNGIAKAIKKARGKTNIPTSGNDVVEELGDFLVAKEQGAENEKKKLTVGANGLIYLAGAKRIRVAWDTKTVGDNYVIYPELSRDQIIDAVNMYKNDHECQIFEMYDYQQALISCAQIVSVGWSNSDANSMDIVVMCGGGVNWGSDSTQPCLAWYSIDNFSEGITTKVFPLEASISAEQFASLLTTTSIGNLETTNKTVVSAINEVSKCEYFTPSDVFTTVSGDLLNIANCTKTNRCFVSNGIAVCNFYFNSSVASSTAGWKHMLHWNTGWKYKIDNSAVSDIAVRCCGSMWSNNAYVNMAFDVYPDDNSGMATVGIKSYYYNNIINQTGGVNMSLTFPVVKR